MQVFITIIVALGWRALLPVVSAAPLLAVAQTNLPLCPLAIAPQISKGASQCWGRITYPDGSFFIGEMELEKPHGEGAKYDRSGRQRWSGFWSEGNLAVFRLLDPAKFPFDGEKASRDLAQRQEAERLTASPQERERQAEHARLAAAAEAERSRQEEQRIAAAVEEERKKRQELEQRLAAAEARERERIQAQAQPAPQSQRPQVTLRPERRIALIVGNAAYKISPLDNPVNDATDVDAGLRRAGFQTTLLRNATLAQMREATRRFADQLPTADVALIYFAGHGIESKGRNYMVPVNADLKFEYELADQAYDANSWLEMLEGIRSANTDRVNIVILDACRDNGLISSRSISRGLGRLDAPSGTFLAYSTAPGKVALDGPRGERNSPFTKHLLRAMQQPNLPIEEVFKEVRRNVSRETSGVQVPWESTSLTGFFTFQRVP